MSRLHRVLPLLLLTTACREPQRPDAKDDSATDTGTDTAEASFCAEVEARLGYRACVDTIPNEATFAAVTLPASSADQLRAGKYLVPARPDARLPTVFLDVNAFPLHYDFLLTAFPDLFAGLTTTAYNAIILYPESREFFAGTFALYLLGAEGTYGFTVWDDPAVASSTVTLDEVTATWTALQAAFALGDLVFFPSSSNQAAAAAGWTDAPFEIGGIDSDLTYEAYNPGVGYGTLRFLPLADLADATRSGTYGWQDILVLDEAPSDLERIVSGIVTGTRQGTLSHLNVRSSARGTPNCFVREPFVALEAWRDHLVRFECGETTWSVADASAEEAAAWWDALRPDPVEIPEADLSCVDMPGLLEVPTANRVERSRALSRWGAKGSNLATLYQRIDPALQLQGFVLPFSAYAEFMEVGTWSVDLGDGETLHSFAETLDAWFQDDAFLSDGALRYDRLDALRDAMEEAPVETLLLDRIGERIREVWGTDTTMVRFRSSSNAEDAMEFSGAGLYESESGCLADQEDGDTRGPSACDPAEARERTVEDALREVWASLWNNEAWEERAWYGIDPSEVAMAVLVNDRSESEQANIVAFTGNPSSDGDDRYLVNAQLGDLDVVSAEPGVWPESVLLTVVDGSVTSILRVSSSSETAAGEVVLNDERLRELGARLWTILQVFPVDTRPPEGSDLLLDTEWKILSDGRLIVKQVRTFLR